MIYEWQSRRTQLLPPPLIKKIPSGVEHADTLKSHSISLGGNQMYGHMLLYMNIMVYGVVWQTEGFV